MQRVNKFLRKILKAEEINGYALIVALLTNMVLLAFCVLSVWIATKDIRISSRMVGEKMALDAAESGIHKLIANFDPENLTASACTNALIDSENIHSFYTVTTPGRPATGPAIIPLPGYSIGGGQQWGQTRYITTVTGTNDQYNSKVEIEVSIGYGPIEITTMSR
jgi:Tfp pilus assembly protein PilX